jgi:hypothetical protein
LPDDLLTLAYWVAQFVAAVGAAIAAVIADRVRKRQAQHQAWELEQLRALARAIDARNGDDEDRPPVRRRRSPSPSPLDEPPVPPQDPKAALRAALIAQRSRHE